MLRRLAPMLLLLLLLLLLLRLSVSVPGPALQTFAGWEMQLLVRPGCAGGCALTWLVGADPLCDLWMSACALPAAQHRLLLSRLDSVLRQSHTAALSMASSSSCVAAAAAAESGPACSTELITQQHREQNAHQRRLQGRCSRSRIALS